ncbi:LAME_0F19570g1_1 [Lachancea meyersii CBS 8951]|uniref:LAME_0F19570g1_1 n=1 Tax=Lachancea meyersii CBS 8951 TaxID=1266667 RepID=A0A1G4K1K1_9SACH|nr:LAME_0F19570g1_1 [Lachancea meyersii CBS 8951]
MSEGDCAAAVTAGYAFGDDQPENYDEFMISDDENDMEIEMDEESDGSFDKLASPPTAQQESDTNGSLVVSAQMLLEERRFQEAATTLEKAATKLQAQSHASAVATLLHIVRCRFFMWTQDSTDFSAVQNAIDGLTNALHSAHSERAALRDLINELAPALGSSLLLNPAWDLNKNPILQSKLFLKGISTLGHKADPFFWRSRSLQYELAASRLSATDTTAVAVGFVEELSNATAKGADQLDNLEFVLTWCVSGSMNGTLAGPTEGLEELVSRISAQLQNFFSRPLPLMATIHFTKAYLVLGQLSATNKKSILQCNTELWQSFKCLEEIGNKTAFQELVFCAFILSSLLLLGQKTQTNDIISPFELEQIKVLETPLSRNLEKLYQAFVEYDLKRFAAALDASDQFSHVIRPLIAAVIHLLQVRMLWHRLAVCYSCISLADIQVLLTVGHLPPLSRNAVLTILMQSIMADTAPVFFKLDLTQDLVYFGDDGRKPLTVYTKDSYLASKDTNGQPDISQGTANMPPIEWIGSIGVFDLPPRRLKGPKPLALVQELKQLREIPAVVDHSQQNATLKYSELADYVRDTLR